MADQTGLPPELQNIAATLNEDELKEIAERCLAEFEEDDRSRKPWLEMNAHWLALYYQQDAPKNPPWRDSSNEGIPMLAEACTQFHARAYQAFFPNKTPFRAIPVGSVSQGDVDRAERVTKHLHHQLMVEDRSYRKKKDALLLSVPLHGCFFTKVYYDPLRGKNCVDNIRAEDFVLPYGIGPRELTEIDRKTHVIFKPVHQTKLWAASGYFLAQAMPWSEGDNKPTTMEIDKATGFQQPGRPDTVYYSKLIEQHRLLDLDGDGIEEPYIVVVDCKARKVLRISIRYGTDGMGIPTEDKAPVEHFVDWNFMPNPDGIYGLGMGHLIGKINTAVNKMLRQTVDAGTLANMKSGFFNKTVDVKKGEIEMKMGKFTGVNPGTGALKDNFMEFTFSGPDQTTFAALQLLMARGDRLATTTEAITGQVDKVQQPTALLALIDQSLQVFSTVYERLFYSWEKELSLVYDLNSKYLPESQYVTVLDLSGLERLQIGKQDYAPDLRIVPVVDTKGGTEKQRLAHAEAEWQFALTNPLIANSPTHLYEASKRYLEAIGSRDIDRILPKIPEPGRVDDPQIENIGLLMPNPVIPPAFPEQDHMKHLMVHEALLKDPIYGPRLPPQSVAQMERHIQTHVAYLYGNTETALPGFLDASGAAGLGPINPMAVAPMHALGSPGTQGGVSSPMGAGPNMGGGQPPQGAGGGVGPSRSNAELV